MKRSAPKRIELTKPAPRRIAVRCAPARGTVRVSERSVGFITVPKSQPVQHKKYMEVVRGLACAHCRRVGPSQFCHSDLGKGSGIKSDCREGWPGCGPHLRGFRMVSGCHYLVGTQRIYPKEKRREIEARMARETRKKVKAMGLWPEDLEWYE